MRTLSRQEIIGLSINPDNYDHIYAMYDDGDNTIVEFLEKGGYKSGFMYKGERITPAEYTATWHEIDNKYILANKFAKCDFYNTSVLLDAETGEVLLEGFAAFFVQGNLLAYRVNGKTCEEHRWGIYDLNARKTLGKAFWKYPAIHVAVDRIIHIRETVKNT